MFFFADRTSGGILDTITSSIPSLDTAKKVIGDATGAVQETVTSVTGGTQEKSRDAKNTAGDALGGFGKVVTDVIAVPVNIVKGAIGGITQGIGGLGNTLGSLMKS